ncbi:hypothetical protein Tco_0704974 [Tanacetum coccineum]|uniref:Uncharacterized protein n=1 Tax=Tanacetum coccineum TaxID=301880 RepID=A0ABQ4Y392_9ASTR
MNGRMQQPYVTHFQQPAQSLVESSSSQQVCQLSRINKDCINASIAGHTNTINAFSTQLPLIPYSKTEYGTKKKELCLHGSDQSLGNKGATPFAEHNIQSASPNAQHSDHNHVVHQHSIVSAMSITKTGCSSQRTLGV